jgi:hypothetical protein
MPDHQTQPGSDFPPGLPWPALRALHGVGLTFAD